MRDAILRGYHRYCVIGDSYPAIAAHKYSLTKGKLLFQLTERAMSAFDEYEDVEHDLYQRIVVQVETDLGESIKAWVYVAGTQLKGKLLGTWSASFFLSAEA